MSVQKSSVLFSFVVSCVLLASSLAQAEPKPSVDLKMAGCGGVAVGALSDGKLNITTTPDCSVTNNFHGSKQTSPYERDLHKLLLAQNPTEILISKVSLGSWREDRGRVSLDVTFSNPRNIPIKSLKAEVMDPASGNSFAKLRAVDLAQSGIFKVINSRYISIPANSSTTLPIAFVDEIQNKLHRISDGESAYDASALVSEAHSGEYQVAEQQAVRNRLPGNNGTFSDTRSMGVLLRLSMESIFGQKIVSHSWVFMRYADKASSAEIWYPNKKTFAPLTCFNPVER